MRENGVIKARLGVVIGSAGIHAFAAIPVLEHLLSQELEPELIIGSSGGGLIAALYGAGFDLTAMKQILEVLSNRKLYNEADGNFIRMLSESANNWDLNYGIMRSDNLSATYRKIFKNMRLEDLKPKTVIYTTDMQTGNGYALERGPVADAVYASGCLFPLMPPLRYKDKLLVDGSFTNPLPIIEAVRRDMDIIISVYYEEKLARLPNTLGNCYLNSVKCFKRSLLRSSTFQSVYYHDHEIINVHIEEKADSQDKGTEKNLEGILKSGHEAIDRHKDGIRNSIETFYMKQAEHPIFEKEDTESEPACKPGNVQYIKRGR